MNVKCYEVKIKLLTPLLGTKPDKEVFVEYLKKVGEENKVTADNLKDEEDTIPVIEDKGTTRFNREKGSGIFIYDYMIKGFLKNAGNVLKEQLGVTALKSKIQEIVFVGPRKIFIHDDFGNIKQSPDEIFIRPKRVKGKFGDVSVLGVSELIKNANMSFTIMVLDNKVKKSGTGAITEEVIRNILDYGCIQGLGQWRNGGYGTFEITDFKEAEMNFSDWAKFCYPNGRSMDDSVIDDN